MYRNTCVIICRAKTLVVRYVEIFLLVQSIFTRFMYSTEKKSYQKKRNNVKTKFHSEKFSRNKVGTRFPFETVRFVDLVPGLVRGPFPEQGREQGQEQGWNKGHGSNISLPMFRSRSRPGPGHA